MFSLLLVSLLFTSVRASSCEVPHAVSFHSERVYEEDPAQHACHLELGVETLAKMESYYSIYIYASKLRLLSPDLHTRVTKKILEQEVQFGEMRESQFECLKKLVGQVEGDGHINTILDSNKVHMRGALLKKLSNGGLLIRGIRDGNDVLVSKQLNIVNQNDVDHAFEEAVDVFRLAQQTRKNVAMTRMVLGLVAEKTSEKAVMSIKPRVTGYTWGIIQKARAKTQASE